MTMTIHTSEELTKRPSWLMQWGVCPIPTLEAGKKGSDNVQSTGSTEHLSLLLEEPDKQPPLSATLTLSWAVVLAQLAGSTTVEFEAQLLLPGFHLATTPARPISVTIIGDGEVSRMIEHLDVQHAESRTAVTPETISRSLEEPHADRSLRDPLISIVMPETWDRSLETHSTDVSHPEMFGSLGTAQETGFRLYIAKGAPLKLKIWITYDRRLYDASHATRFLHHFQHIARQLLCRKAAVNRIRELDMLSGSDLETIRRWNSEPVHPISTRLQDLVAAHAQANPDAPAVSAWDGGFTYAELELQASRLSEMLIQEGLPKGTMVPLLFEKSKWMVVSMVAVLKAGGVCVGVCAKLSDSTVQSIISETQDTWILASKSQVRRILNRERKKQAAWILPQVLESAAPAQPTLKGCPRPDATTGSADDVAFVIFTSGSTGKPKGVLLHHGALATSVHHHGNAVSVQSNSRVLQLSSYAFDMSVIETWHALSRGACLCIPSETERLWDLPSFVRRHRPSWAAFTPTMLRDYKPSDLPGLKNIVLCGENVPRELVLRWKGHARLFNFYGPVETVGGAACEILPETWIPGTFGRGAGSILWITDPEDSGRLAPVGAVGEIVIEGPVVTRGYLRDPARTQEVFISSPPWRSQFSFSLPSSFYKTGDLGQYNADGSVRYISRKDAVVKINGQRVDIDAIEFVMRTLEPDVNVAVDAVSLESRGSSGPVLVAFVQSDDGVDACTDSFVALRNRHQNGWAALTLRLKDGIRQRLPSYMVPMFFIPLLTLPRGATGKVDKKALRAFFACQDYASLVELLSLTPAEERRPAQTHAESLLAATVAQVTGVQAALIDMNSSFAELGIDSVSVIRVVRLLSEQGQSMTVEHTLAGTTSLADVAMKMCPIARALQAVPPAFQLLDLEYHDGVAKGSREALLDLAARQCGITKDQVEDILPSTPLQDSLVTATSAIATDAYVDRFVFKIPRTSRLQDIQRVWNSIFDSVSILRTRIIEGPTGKSYQVVVRHVAQWDRYESVDSFVNEKQKKVDDAPASMSFGKPLVRLGLISSGLGDTQQSWLAVTFHHAIYDAWSLSLLVRQAEALYQGAKQPDLLPFSLFVRHLQEHQDDSAMARFWQREMADVPPAGFPEYPTVAYQPKANSSVTVTACRLPSHSSTSPTVRVRFAWSLLLGLYGGTQDVVYGVVSDGRQIDLPGIESVVGPTIATFPVRTVLKQDSTVRETLEDIQRRLETMAPFEHSGIQNISRTGADAATACRFRSLLVVQSDSDTVESPILGRGEACHGRLGGLSNYSLVLLCRPTEDSWELELLFDETIMGPEQAHRVLEQLAHLLAESNDEERLVSEVNLLCPADNGQLGRWHHSPVPRVDRCVHDLISGRCEADPGKMAVQAWDGSLTYGQLHRYSNYVAAHLIHTNRVGRDSIVPVLSGRSQWVPVVMLAIMKSGAAFVLLDPEQPLARNKKICATVRAEIVLTSPSEIVHGESLACVVDVMSSEAIASIAAQSPLGQQVPARTASPGDPAYIVYTSGSTGEPKCVVIQHDAFASAISAQSECLHIHKDTRVLQLSSHAFDSFAPEILTTLASGGTVCIPSDEECRHNIAGAIQRFQATWLVTTPSIMRVIGVDEVPTLRTLVAVGEPMLSRQAATWAARKDLKLICGYGPTECCTGASAQPLDKRQIDVRNIGAGMGAHLWIVHPDNHHSLVPIGCIGELVIRGPIVGREYLGLSEMTAASFLDTANWVHLFPHTGCERLYKTGDLARYNQDGTVTFLGRRSQQVKLRGQRLSIVEVEDHLGRALGPGSNVVAAVVTPGGESAHPTLVAMVEYPSCSSPSDSPSDSSSYSLSPSSSSSSFCPPKLPASFCPPVQKFTEHATKAHQTLSALLPAVMLPSLYLQVPCMPLLASGKVNRRALEESATSLSSQELFALGSFTAAQDAELLGPDEGLSHVLSQSVWEILKVKLGSTESSSAVVGRNVAPSQLGLDSIDMMSLSRAMSKRFNITIPTTLLFDSSLTVRKLADLISACSTLPTTVKNEKGQVQQSNGGAALQPTGWKHAYEKLCRIIDALPHSSSTACADKKRPPPSGRVFLTGATGFLGSHILRQLVLRPDIQCITVLVRDRDASRGMIRVVRAAQEQRWWRDHYRRVLQVWTGDISKPRLGLSDRNWEILAGRSGNSSQAFDAIIHNAAMVHWLHDYSTLEATNVQSTVQLLTALSTCPSSVRFIYVSALLPDDDGNQSGDPEVTCASADGYSQTKYVSELLLRRYVRDGARAHRTAIVRSGSAIGTLDDGIANVDDVLWRTVSAAVKVGVYNASEDDSWMFLAPVDWIATVIVHQALDLLPTHKRLQVLVTSISDGLRVRDFWSAVSQISLQPLTPVDEKQWLTLIRSDVQVEDDSHPLWPVMDLVETTKGCIGLPWRQTGSSAQSAILRSIIWMAVLRNAQYIMSLALRGDSLRTTRKAART